MNILLINDNPVVSRLLVLCTRGAHIGLDEVKRVDDIQDVRYDILFVDDASYVDQVDALLEDRRIRKKVFISYDKGRVKGFDETIQKPFLPSQIMKVIESIDMSEIIEDAKEENIDIFPLPIEDEVSNTVLESEGDTGTEILNRDEIEKIKALLDMDDEVDMDEDDAHLSDDVYEARKVKVIKEQLIADGLEIVEEDEIVEELSVEAVDSIEESDKKLEKKKKSKKEKKRKELPFNEDERSRIEAAVAVALDKMKPKKIKKLLKGKKIEIKIKLEDDK